MYSVEEWNRRTTLPASGEPIQVEAVAVTRARKNGGLALEWLIEGGISALEAPDVLLLVAHGTVTDDQGSGEVYLVPPAAAPVAAGDPVARELLRQAFRLISTKEPEGVAAGLDDPSKQAWWYRECNPTAMAIAEYLGKNLTPPAAAEPVYQVEFRGLDGGGWHDVDRETMELRKAEPKHWHVRTLYADRPAAASADEPLQYRLLRLGEVILATDELLMDDCITWQSMSDGPQLGIGREWHAGLVPMRRVEVAERPQGDGSADHA